MATGYKSLKGPLRGVIGEKWRFREPLGELKWDLGPSSARDEMKTLLQKFEPDQDERSLAESSGVYSAGKRLYRLASIALAARQVGDKELTRKHGLKLKKALRPWLAADANSLLVYDASHGGVVTRAGYKDAHADFGNGKYNDHHFHYGLAAGVPPSGRRPHAVAARRLPRPRFGCGQTPRLRRGRPAPF